MIYITTRERNMEMTNNNSSNASITTRTTNVNQGPSSVSDFVF